MPTYATQANCLALIDGLTIGDVIAFDRLIEKAERDIDSVVGIIEPNAIGRKFTPASLSASDRDALVQATVAQVEYRIEMGPTFFVRPQHDSVRGPDYQTSGKLPMVAAVVYDRLEGSGLFRLTTSFKGAHKSPPWASFSHNVGDEFLDRNGPVR